MVAGFQGNELYFEAHENEYGIVLCCDFCRDMMRDRIIKQMGWTLTMEAANDAISEHLELHTIISASNDPR